MIILNLLTLIEIFIYQVKYQIIKPEEKKEEVKPEEKKEEIKPEEKKEEVKPEEKKDEIKPEEKKEEVKPEEKKEEPEKKEPPKIEGKPKTILMMKFITNFEKYSPYLTDLDIFTLGKVCKKFNKPCLEKLKQKIEKELETINKEGIKLTELTLSKVATKALASLNEKNHMEYFQKEETPEDIVILVYRILLQLINKEKDILNEKDNNKFWKLFRENLLKNSEKGIGDYIQNEFKNLDYSGENIHKLKIMCAGNEEKLGPVNIGKNDPTAKFICFLIKEALEYIKIFIGSNKNKKVNNSEAYKKYLEYLINKINEKLANL